MRWIVVLAMAVAMAMLSASGASAGSTKAQPIVFGFGGGSLAPFQITIEPNGQVAATGSAHPKRHHLSRGKVASLSALVRQELAAGLASRMCHGTLPDFGSHFVRAYGRTVRVHGTCEPLFQQLWAKLTQSVGLGVG